MTSKLLLAVALVLAAAGTAFGAATGDQIRSAISDTTVTGNMDASGPYAEFYQADGAIKGKDYTGTWTIVDDTMCFAYPDTPTACYAVEVEGDQVRWLKDGKSLGTGTIVKGNTNGF